MLEAMLPNSCVVIMWSAYSHKRDSGTGEYYTVSRLRQLILVQTKKKKQQQGIKCFAESSRIFATPANG